VNIQALISIRICKTENRSAFAYLQNIDMFYAGKAEQLSALHQSNIAWRNDNHRQHLQRRRG